MGSWTWTVSNVVIDTDLVWHRNTKGTQKTQREKTKVNTCRQTCPTWIHPAHVTAQNRSRVWEKNPNSSSTLKQLWPNTTDSQRLKPIHSFSVTQQHARPTCSWAAHLRERRGERRDGRGAEAPWVVRQKEPEGETEAPDGKWQQYQSQKYFLKVSLRATSTGG